MDWTLHDSARAKQNLARNLPDLNQLPTDVDEEVIIDFQSDDETLAARFARKRTPLKKRRFIYIDLSDDDETIDTVIDSSVQPNKHKVDIDAEKVVCGVEAFVKNKKGKSSAISCSNIKSENKQQSLKKGPVLIRDEFDLRFKDTFAIGLPNLPLPGYYSRFIHSPRHSHAIVTTATDDSLQTKFGEVHGCPTRRINDCRAESSAQDFNILNAGPFKYEPASCSKDDKSLTPGKRTSPANYSYCIHSDTSDEDVISKQ